MNPLVKEAWNNFIEALNTLEPLGSEKVKDKKGKEQLKTQRHVNLLGSIAKHEKIFMEANKDLKVNPLLANTTENRRSKVITESHVTAPCPACKSSKTWIWQFPTTYAVMCNTCGVSSGHYQELNQALNNWNSMSR